MEVAAALTDKAHSVSIIGIESVPFKRALGEKVGKAIMKVKDTLLGNQSFECMNSLLKTLKKYFKCFLVHASVNTKKSLLHYDSFHNSSSLVQTKPIFTMLI